MGESSYAETTKDSREMEARRIKDPRLSLIFLYNKFINYNNDLDDMILYC
jgi:hypothetical protein